MKVILYSICAIAAVLIPWFLTFIIGRPHLPLWSAWTISSLTALVAGFIFARKQGKSVHGNILRALPWTVLYLTVGSAIFISFIITVMRQPR
ncbi:MAG TPA: hypothetical protein PKK43_02605 [Spirochaetota bacterium]|nr:hypothetical protein [Spirochaetota bacterium]